MPSLDPDLIRSALLTLAPEAVIAGKVGTSHWRTVCTVYTETGASFLVTGYDPTRPRLSECAAAVPVELTSIYDVIERDHPAIAALHRQNEPHVHYTGPSIERAAE